MQQYDLILTAEQSLHIYHEDIMTLADMIEKCKVSNVERKYNIFYTALDHRERGS